MAIGSRAGCRAACLILGITAVAAAARFPVRHKHRNGGCAGVMTVDAAGVSFAGPKKHSWHWKLQDIHELKLAPDGIDVLSYHGRFHFVGATPVAQLYGMLSGIMDQRLVMEAAEPGAQGMPAGAVWSAAVKHRGGADGLLAFGPNNVVYASPARDESRTWRYRDIDAISSSGPFQLTVTTFERALEHYQDRREFNFELKHPITEAEYNQLWLLVEQKNGRIR